MSTTGDLTVPSGTEPPCSDTDPDSKLSKLQKSYGLLLTSTARLLQRTSKRQKSNRDLERTVKYLRALYNQVSPKEHTKEHTADPEEPHDDALEEGVQSLMNKRVFMV